MEKPKLISLLKVNDTFASYKDFQKTLEQYQLLNKIQFWISDAKRLHRASPSVYTIVKNHPELEYCSIKLSCIYGGKDRKRIKLPLRKRRTFKLGCKAEIFLTLNEFKNRLIVHRLEEKHNHDIFSGEVRDRFTPKKVSKKMRRHRQISSMSKLRQREESENISLTNLVKTNSLSRSKNFQKIANILKNKYFCNVDLQYDETDKIIGFFFQDVYMKKCFQLFPEILLIDSSYKLQNIQSPLYTFSVENSTGVSTIVGVAILTVLDENSIQWMLDRFKHRNPEWKNTNIVLTDRNSYERKIPHEFPDAKKLICTYHSIYVFKKEVSKIDVTLSEITQSLDFFKKLAFAESEDEYFTILEDMEDDIALPITEYFYNQWHIFRKFWVKGLLKIRDFIGCKLEDKNSKFRNTIGSCNSFLNFVENLFTMLYSQRKQLESNIQKEEIVIENEAAIVMYKKYLTQYAFQKIKNNLHQTENNSLKFDFITKNDDTILQIDDNCYIVSKFSCSCDFFTIMKLPCEHLLAYRNQQGIDLFKHLFSERWTKKHLQKLFESEVQSCIKTQDSSVDVETVCLDLAELCDEATEEEFDERFNLLVELKQKWENGDKVVLSIAKSGENMEFDEDCESEKIIVEFTA